jgi:hypothetical protein
VAQQQLELSWPSLALAGLRMLCSPLSMSYFFFFIK